MDVRGFHPMLEPAPDTRDNHRLRLLIDTGLLLASGRSLDHIVQSALDAGLALCGATYGVFFYNVLDVNGELSRRHKVAAADPDTLPDFGRPVPVSVLAPEPLDEATVRANDPSELSRHGRSNLFAGILADHVSLRSYLAVPVRSRGDEVLGTLVYGHPDRGMFLADAEDLVATIAAQAAVAIENVRLTETLSREIGLADAARAQQQSSDYRLRQALEATQLGTWTWDAATGMVDLDQRAADLFGVPAHVPIPRSRLREQIVKEDQPLSPENLRDAIKNGRQYTAEYRVELPDGTCRWLAASGSPILAGRLTRIRGMVGTLQDISQRKTQEALLRQNEKLAATGRLAASIAHEINNPLEAVTNLIYLAKTDPTTPSVVQKLLETADNELARVSHIAQQTLGFYRDTTRPVSIDLNDLLKAVVELFGRKLAVKRLECTLDLEPGISIIGLQGEIRQVVANLLVNAIDASPGTGGAIRIRSRHRRFNGNTGACLLISDQGSGIPHHIRPRLFDPFITTKEKHGTGLGLWVSRGMVEKHGGSVRFRSRTDLPSGTVFRVYLPTAGHAQLFQQQRTAVLQ